MPFYTYEGHPTGGTTVQRPTNVEIGFRYYDTTIGATVTWNGTAWIPPRLPTSTVAVGGTAQANAAALSEGFNLVTGADGTAAVVLPTNPVAGMVVRLKNNAAAILKVFPAVNCTVNAGAANAVFNQPSLTACSLTAYNATAWYSEPLLPS